MLCPCSAGAVPLAVIITKGQTEDSYVKGFQLLNEALENPFNNKGHPEIFMTDDSDAEIEALQNIWPASRNLLCIFHVAQAVWRWLWDSSHQIPKQHRNKLMLIFQHIMYPQTVEEAEEAYKNACGYIGVYLPTYENWNKKSTSKRFFEPLLLEITATREVEEAHPAVTEKISLSSYVPEDNNSSYEEKRKDLLKEIFSVMSHNDQKHKYSLSGLNKFLKKLQNVKSSGSWESFLHTAGNGVGIRRRYGAAIRVQPTSIARRSTFITRGSKRFPVGRPAVAPLSEKKEALLRSQHQI
ncbi:hypothetical protein AVEN_169767-1 [Araneus ventricosus]|uniref:MULE transposase domain-containing protein n=1 Tax=Araneus ventricosus TaxID=182803 RepID=A0A4Y2HL64_ARAVE|nr:hypothetical protein AVEN_169767-1 [Araneus ventricosus]